MKKKFQDVSGRGFFVFFLAPAHTPRSTRKIITAQTDGRYDNKESETTSFCPSVEEENREGVLD